MAIMLMLLVMEHQTQLVFMVKHIRDTVRLRQQPIGGVEHVIQLGMMINIPLCGVRAQIFQETKG